MKVEKPHILILAGGTGGHVYPALAVAEVLLEKGNSLTWFGLESKIEYKVAKDAKIPFYKLKGTGVRGKSILLKIKGLFSISLDCWKIYIWLGKNRPQAAIGFGGYSSFAAGIACFFRNIPLAIQEQNAIAGSSNKVLSKLAKKVFLGYEGALPQSGKIIVTGNPVRSIFKAQKHINKSDSLRILVLGGSLGSQRINTSVANALTSMDLPHKIQVTHQCGANHFESTKEIYEKSNNKKLSINLLEFLNNIYEYYSNTDLIICRAGAMTLAEIDVYNIPALIVPYPHAIDDHQTSNAKSFLKSSPGWIVSDNKCSTEYIINWLNDWVKQTPSQAQQDIYSLKQKFLKPSNNNAAQEIAKQVEDIYKNE